MSSVMNCSNNFGSLVIGYKNPSSFMFVGVVLLCRLEIFCTFCFFPFVNPFP